MDLWECRFDFSRWQNVPVASVALCADPRRSILENTAENYLVSDYLTRGAAIASYSVTSLIPVLVIVIAIAGLVFGEGAARGAIVAELTTLIGSDSAKLIQEAIENAYASGANGFALVVGAIILALTVSGQHRPKTKLRCSTSPDAQGFVPGIYPPFYHCACI